MVLSPELFIFVGLCIDLLDPGEHNEKLKWRTSATRQSLRVFAQHLVQEKPGLGCGIQQLLLQLYRCVVFG